MINDAGVKETDELLEKMEKRLNTQYYAAEAESKRKLKAFLKEYEAQNKEKKKDLKAGKITQAEYDSWLKSQATRKTWLTEMANTLAEDHTTTDVKAMSIVRGFMPEAYAINRNFGAFEAEAGALVDTSFTLYDAHTVEALVRDRPNLLPEPKPDIPKELRWHKQKITNAITQGILQGESIPDIAKRLQGVTDMDRRAAIRNARTATTGAQNAGRVDSYRDAERMGIRMKQEWLSTLDGRTRDSHRMMDGERVDVGKRFSNGCRYPGDPHGPAHEIYNCRCTLVAAVDGVDQSNARRFSRLESMSYDEWKWGKEGEEKRLKYELKSAENKFKQIEDRVYSGIWRNQDVHLSDYASKKDSIQGKLDYYESRLHTLDQRELQFQDDHDMLEAIKKEKDEIKKHISDLEDFQRRGEEYLSLQREVSDLKKQLRVYGKGDPFTADAYTPERKSQARSFSRRTEADKYLRPELDSQWGDLEDREKYGVWKYTQNSNPENKALSGYEDDWDRSSFKGVGNADWSHEDPWRSNPDAFRKFGHADGHVDHAAAISDLTTAIDKCPTSDDMWFRRGSDNQGFAGFLEGGNTLTFDEAKRLINRGDINTLKKLCEGQEFQVHSFFSTGIADDAGFHESVNYKVYAPSGTKAIYAEPQSYYGLTVAHDSSLYYPGQAYSSVGSEAEMIFQRGTTYRITEIEYTGSGYEVSLEVVGQPDYFKTGFEQTFDDGATSFVPRKK